MDKFMIQYNCRSRYLVVIYGDVYIYKYEKCKFDQPFLSFRAKYFFNCRSKVCEMTNISGACDISDFDGNTFLLECDDSENVSICGLKIFKFKTHDKIVDYMSLMGNIMCPYTFAVGEKNAYFISTH